MKILQAVSLIVHMLAATWLQSQLSELNAFLYMIIRCNAAFRTTIEDITNTHGETSKRLYITLQLILLNRNTAMFRYVQLILFSRTAATLKDASHTELNKA